jgi:hypothetical protein
MEAGAAGGVAPPGHAEGQAAGASLPRRPARGRLAGIAVALVVLVVLGAGIAGWILGASYQPVTYGLGGSGIDGGSVIVHGFLPRTIYIPPQRPASGGLFVSLMNTGRFAVTVESVSLPSQPRPPVLRDAGPATYEPLEGNNPLMPTAASPRIAGLVLRPGQDVYIRIPFRTPGCWQAGRTVVSTFLVTTRYLLWTRQFPVAFTDPGVPSEGLILAQVPC